MGFDGAGGDEEFFGDRDVGAAADHEFEDFEFAFGEGVGGEEVLIFGFDGVDFDRPFAFGFGEGHSLAHLAEDDVGDRWIDPGVAAVGDGDGFDQSVHAGVFHTVGVGSSGEGGKDGFFVTLHRQDDRPGGNFGAFGLESSKLADHFDPIHPW